jgi:hypothetical protein
MSAEGESSVTDWSRPPRPAELDRLDAFAGEWISVDEHRPTPWAPDGGPGASRHRLRRALDGYAFLSDFEGETPFGGITGHAVWFFDRESGSYRVFWYDNFANALRGEGGFAPDGTLVMTYRYRMAGEDVLERHSMRLAGADGWTQTIENWLEGRYQVASTLRWRRAGHV